MNLHLGKKSFLKSKTLWGLVAAFGGPAVVGPALISAAPGILSAIGVSGHTAGLIVGGVGAAVGAYGRFRATQALG